MRQIAFTADAFKEYNEWFQSAGVIEKIKILIRDIDRDPFHGLGKNIRSFIKLRIHR